MERIHYTTCSCCNSSKIEKVLSLKDHSISKEDYELWQCQECSFRFTQDVPSQKFIAPYYKSEDYISHSDTKKGVINNMYHRVRKIMLERKYQLIKKYSQVNKLLDYGVGTGYFPNHVQSKGHQVKGIEIDPNAREYGKQKFGIDVYSPEVLSDGTFKNEEFDVISLWHVLEHLYDPKTYLKRFRELLMTNGHLVLAVPNYTSSDGQYYQDKWAAYDVPIHLWHFEPKTMEKMVEPLGFQLVDKKKMVFDSFYVSLLSEKYKNGKVSLIRGFLHGFSSFLKANKDVDKCSSVIYVFRKV